MRRHAHFGFAAFILGRKARPNLAFTGTVEIDLAAVAAAALVEPDQHLGEHAQLIRVGGSGLAQGFEAARAEVIAASFDDHGAHLGFEGVSEVGDVLLDQLVLQGDGVGGDDHAHGVLERPLHGGDEVGKGFARAGAGFHHQVLAFGEGMADRAQHFDLLGAALEIVKVMGEGTAVLNVGGHLVIIQWRGGLHGDERRQGDAGAEEVTVIILAGFFGFDGHAPFFLQRSLEHGSAVPINAFTEPDGFSKDLNGELEKLLVKTVEDGMGEEGIIVSAMAVLQNTAKSLPKCAQVVAAIGGQGDGSQLVGINDIIILEDLVALQKGKVKTHVVPDDGIIPHEISELLQHILQFWGVAHHLIGDAGELGDEWGNRFAGIYQSGPFVVHPVPGKAHGSDLQDGVPGGIQSGGFDINGDHLGHGAIITCRLASRKNLPVLVIGEVD